MHYTKWTLTLNLHTINNNRHDSSVAEILRHHKMSLSCLQSWCTAMCFLTRTFHNVFYVRVGKCYIRLWHSQRLQTVVWGDGSWKTLATAIAGTGATPAAAPGAMDTPPACKPNPNLNQWLPQALFWLKLDNSCCYGRYGCCNNCNVVVKLVQECKFFMHFTSVLRKQFAANDTFLREVNGYKRVLASRNARVQCPFRHWFGCQISTARISHPWSGVMAQP